MNKNSAMSLIIYHLSRVFLCVMFLYFYYLCVIVDQTKRGPGGVGPAVVALSLFQEGQCISKVCPASPYIETGGGEPNWRCKRTNH